MKIAIITARGGSKRIPKKNIRDFCGKPIISYSIEAALECGIFDEVMVSTDSEEIARIAREYGADVPFMRSRKTSGDYTVTADVVWEVLGQFEAMGKKYELFACIYPTAPFVTPEKLKCATIRLQESVDYSLIPVVAYSFPPQRSFMIKNSLLQYVYPKYEKARSQDLTPVYHDAGQFYICKTESFKKYGSFVTPRTVPFVVPEEEVQDIDNDSDWEIAEIKFKLLKKKGERSYNADQGV